jgi:hypothetical protein
MTRRLVLPLAAGLVAVTTLGCGDSTGPGSEIVVTGTVQNNSQAAIPAGARVLVVWVVSETASDYSFVHGEGTIDAAAGTFRVELTAPPPAALNGERLGVGVIILTTDASIGEGDDIDGVAEADIVGAAGLYGVIYIAGTPDEASGFRGWAADFPAGFGVGVGQAVPGDFDRFVPVDASDVVLIVDDFANLEFVNWT